MNNFYKHAYYLQESQKVGLTIYKIMVHQSQIIMILRCNYKIDFNQICINHLVI